MDESRSLPQSMDAERAVLGGLMLDCERMADIHEIVDPDDFYRETHQKLYRLMVEMNTRGEPIEMVSVVEAIGLDNEPITGLGITVRIVVE